MNLIGQGHHALEAKVEYCEHLYSAAGLPTIFRISTAVQTDLDRLLDERGYSSAEDETLMLSMDIQPQAPHIEDEVVLDETMPTDLWLEALGDLQGQNRAARIAHRKILQAIAVPSVFAAIHSEEGYPVALAFGAVHDRMVCINSVATHPSFRRRGMAQRVIRAILSWSQHKAKADAACVPVVAANEPAVSLYRALGFTKETGRYHYRRRATR